MKKLLLASALAAGATFGLQELTFSHGGTYRGPGDTVPPGGGGGGGGGGPSTPGPGGPGSPGPSGPSTPGPVGPGSPGGSPGAPASPTTGGGGGGPDLTAWTFWWEFNKEPYLNLKAMIHAGGTQTGSDGWWLGQGTKNDAKDSMRPSEEQIRQKVVPALLRALETESNNDILTGCMVALAKIGDEKDESGSSKFVEAIKPHLKSKVQEIAETAAVALGILANEDSAPDLVGLMRDNAVGRGLVGGGEVSLRTRAFAAYGLALLGARTQKEGKRSEIIENLVDVLENDQSSMRDIKVACLISIGLVPLEQIHPSDAAAEVKTLAAQSCRVGQIEYLIRYFENVKENHYLIRAHAPAALARLLTGLPVEDHAAYKSRVAKLLLDGCEKNSKEKNEVIESCILALGQIGDNDSEKLDEQIRTALIDATKDQSDQQSRNFSLIALAQTGGRIGAGDAPAKNKVSDHLQKSLAGKSQLQPWAGMAIGVYGRALTDNGAAAPAEAAMALRKVLEEEKSGDKLGAYAIAVGILKDLEARETLLEKLDKTKEELPRGYITVGLGLMGAREAIAPIQSIIKESKYKADLLKQAAIALGLLGDKELVPDLIKMLEEAKGLATQAALASALGTIGDSRSIDPLVAMLENKDITDSARGFAAVALGIVADKEALPWNSKISVDLNYRATTSTLNDTEGTGILNIL
jgi:HEAT repeat protein